MMTRAIALKYLRKLFKYIQSIKTLKMTAEMEG
jgi:hypothetical protein